MRPLGLARRLRVAGSRVLQAAITALGASVLAWALLSIAPGDPALRILQAQGRDNPEPAQIEETRRELGLDRPLPAQFGAWLARLARGDLSVSYRSGRPVSEELGKRLPATLALVGCSMAISLAVSFSAALASVFWYGSWPDRAILAATRIFASLPSFLMGLLVLEYVVVSAKVGRVLTEGDGRYMLFPAACLATMKSANWTQLLRASMLEALGASYSLVARSRGASRLRVILTYALPNAMLPFLASFGMSIGAMIGGSPIIESLFSWPGIGSYVLQSIAARDYPAVQGFVLISGLAYVLAGMLTDLASALLDPRIGVSS